LFSGLGSRVRPVEFAPLDSANSPAAQGAAGFRPPPLVPDDKGPSLGPLSFCPAEFATNPHGELPSRTCAASRIDPNGVRSVQTGGLPSREKRGRVQIPSSGTKWQGILRGPLAPPSSPQTHTADSLVSRP